MKRKINLTYLILDIMLLLPITTLLQGIIPPINRICLAGIIILVIWVLFRDSYKVNDVLILCCFVIVYTWALFVTDGMAYHFSIVLNDTDGVSEILSISLGSAQTKYVSKEVSEGFTGVVLGLYAVGENRAEFTNLNITYTEN